MSRLSDVIARIPAADAAMHARAAERQASLAKPLGSLGRLEDLAPRIVAATGEGRRRSDRRTILVFAGDHGVARSGVSAYPSEVTALVVDLIATGRAAINAFADAVGARVVIVDVGLATSSAEPAVISRAVGRGTADLSLGAAMTRAAAFQAIDVGLDMVATEGARGVDLLAIGEVGIGNTTSSSALIAAFTGAGADVVVGRGAGLDDEGLVRKRAIVERALGRREARADVIGTLAELGGYEIAALVGACLGAAEARIPLILDGVTTAAAALVAARLSPACVDHLIAGHLSPEPAHALALDALGLSPLLSFGMRLGEGTGAALALPVVAAALRTYADAATLQEVLAGL